MYHYVYEITNLINHKKYIGKRSSKVPIEEDKYMGSGINIKRAIKKYGLENFKKEILEVCETEETAFEREIFYIEEVKAYNNPNYYNLSSGGNGGFGSFASKSEEEIDLWKKRMSESRKGRVITKEWQEKILKTRKEKGIGIGKNNPMYGRKGKDSPTSKPIVMIDFNGTVVKHFDCARACNDYLNKKTSSSAISAVCLGHRGTAYGYFWLFESDYEQKIKDNTYYIWLEYMIDRYINKNINKKQKKDIYKINSNYVKPKENKRNKVAVYCVTLNKKYDSVQNAIDDLGLCQGANITAVCRGKRHSAGKHPKTGQPLSWVFYEDYITNKNIKNIV